MSQCMMGLSFFCQIGKDWVRNLVKVPIERSLHAQSKNPKTLLGLSTRFKHFEQIDALKKDKPVLICNKIWTLHVERSSLQGLGLEL